MLWSSSRKLAAAAGEMQAGAAALQQLVGELLGTSISRTSSFGSALSTDLSSVTAAFLADADARDAWCSEIAAEAMSGCGCG